MVGGAGRWSAAGHAAKAGTNTSGAGGLYPSDVWGLMIGIARVNCCKGGTAALVKAMTTSGPSAISSPAYSRKVRIASFGDFAMGYENRVGLVLAKPLNEIVNVRRQAIFNVNAALENSESQVGTGRLLQSISACVPRLDCMSSLPGRVLINSRLNVRCAPKSTEILSHRETWFPCRPRSGAFRVSAV